MSVCFIWVPAHKHERIIKLVETVLSGRGRQCTFKLAASCQSRPRKKKYPDVFSPVPHDSNVSLCCFTCPAPECLVLLFTAAFRPSPYLMFLRLFLQPREGELHECALLDGLLSARLSCRSHLRLPAPGWTSCLSQGGREPPVGRRSGFQPKTGHSTSTGVGFTLLWSASFGYLC